MEFGTGDSKKRLGISGVAESREQVEEYALEVKGGAELLRHITERCAKKVGAFVCAECANCESMEVKVDQMKDHANMRTIVSVRAGCKKAMGRVGSPECPDGFNIFERGWKSGVKTEEVASYGDHMLGRIVTGYEYSENSPDPLTMNHLTIEERSQQCDALRVSIERGETAGRYNRTTRETTFEIPGREVTFHQNGGVTSHSSGTVSEPPTIRWSDERAKNRPMLGEASADTFKREYMNDFSASARVYVPAKPKDVPSSPDTGTW